MNYNKNEQSIVLSSFLDFKSKPAPLFKSIYNYIIFY